MNINKLLKISTLAGQILLESGAETYRVEETIIKICTAFGAHNTESFVIPTGIISTVTYEDNVSTLVVRIKYRGVDLNKIDKINDLSRKLQNSLITLEELDDELKKINNSFQYSFFVNILFSFLITGSFSVLFGGNMHDFLCAGLIGPVIKIVTHVCTYLSINEFFINALSGAITALLAFILVKFNIGHNLDMIIIGSIMLLVPGLTITNAIRDTIAGDILSGLAKAAEAFLIAVSIAAGTGGVLSVLLSNL